MALNLWKWCVAAIAGCGLLWVWMFHGPSRDSSAKALENINLSNAPAISAEMNRAVDRLRLIQLRDSLTRATAKAPAELTVLIDPGYGAPLSRAIETKLRERWSKLRAPSKVPVVIAAVIDSSSTVSGFVRRKPSAYAPPITTFLPSEATASRCVSLVRLPVNVDARTPKYVATNLLSPQSIDALLTPCIYYAAYGAPGPRIEQWLRDGEWRLAHHADWSTPAPHWDQPMYTGGMMFANKLASTDEPAWRVRAVLTTSGVECLGGTAGRCLGAAMAPRSTPDDSIWAANVVSSSGANQFSFYYPPSPTNLGPYDGWLVPEMARSLGNERFAAFWHSNAAVPDAFRAASGEDMDHWVREWGNRVYGSIAIGPGIPPTAIISGVFAFGLGIIIAISIARRRRVA